MDTLTDDRRIIRGIMTDYARIPSAYGDIQTEAVFDPEGDHGCLAHVDLIGGKFWIQGDGTEQGPSADLEAAGVPKDRIVLAFRAPEVRPHTGSAVA